MSADAVAAASEVSSSPAAEGKEAGAGLEASGETLPDFGNVENQTWGDCSGSAWHDIPDFGDSRGNGSGDLPDFVDDSKQNDGVALEDSHEKADDSRESDGDVHEERKTGGTYGELTSSDQWGGHLEEEPPHEVHHMPADSVNGLERNDGPAIVMEKADHRETASCGNSRDAQEYRAQQQELVKEGKFKEAMQMDIDDIHEKFGDKYDDAISQMQEAAEEKGLI